MKNRENLEVGVQRLYYAVWGVWVLVELISISLDWKKSVIPSGLE